MSLHLRALIGRRVTVRLAIIAGIVSLQILLTIATALVVKQNQSLRDEASMYQALAAPPVGGDVPPITGIDWTGVERAVFYDQERPTLIYAFSKDCGPCVSNWVAMRAIQKMSPDRLRIVYVDLIDALAGDYLREHGMESDVVFSRLDPRSTLHYRVRATPQSALVDRSGRVVWSKLGKFSPDDVASLLAIVEEHEQQLSEVKGVQQ
jgi:hypothetical protein